MGLPSADEIGAFAGVAGVAIAVVALVYSVVQAKRLAEDSLRERRIEFELGLLAQMSQQWAASRTYAHLTDHLRALLPEKSGELPLTRQLTGVRPDAASHDALEAVKQRLPRNIAGEPRALDEALSQALVAELQEAIARRVDEGR
jgi:hypothetical protein